MLAAALAAWLLLSAPTGPERPQAVEPAAHKPTPRLTVLFFTAECEPCHAVDLVLQHSALLPEMIVLLRLGRC